MTVRSRTPAFEDRDQFLFLGLGLLALRARGERLLEEYGGPAVPAATSPAPEDLVDALLGAWALLDRVDGWAVAAAAPSRDAAEASSSLALRALLR